MINSSTKTLISKRASRNNRHRDERGAVLVEAAICIPLLLLLILGLAEAGFAWEARSATVSGVRTGVIRASQLADAEDTDLRVLQSIVGEIGTDNVDRLESVMIFEASGDPAAKFADCGNPSAECVVYDAAFVQSVAATTNESTILSQLSSGGTCTPGAEDVAWCAAERTNGGDSTLAVAIKYNHEWFTGIFPFAPPVFEEFVVSSTFTDGGVDVTVTGP